MRDQSSPIPKCKSRQFRWRWLRHPVPLFNFFFTFEYEIDGHAFHHVMILPIGKLVDFSRN
jgi:hypothetical protein